MKKLNVSILSIGEELVFGQIADTNAAYMASRLWEKGLKVVEIRVVGDDLNNIVSAIKDLTEKSSVLLLTGGLGPTDDDLTRNAIAKALGVGLKESGESLQQIKARFKAINHPMSDKNKVQAMLPEGASGIKNDYGTAPGIEAEIDGCCCFAMPGVPVEMKNMFDNFILPKIGNDGQNTTLIKELKLFGIGESTVGEKIASLMVRGRNPNVGTRVSESIIAVRVIANSKSREEAEKLLLSDEEEIRSLLGEYIFGEDGDTPESVIVKKLSASGKTLAIAESCTGGLISKLITDIPGSSAVLLESFITYTNAAKVKRLGVKEEALEKFGAVSEDTAKQMAEGVRYVSGASYGIGVTGIAGPSGGTEEKPVGLVYIAISGDFGVECRECRFVQNRETNRKRAANTALAMLLKRTASASIKP